MKANLGIYWSIYIPTLIFGHELRAVTERVRSDLQVVEMSSLQKGGWPLTERWGEECNHSKGA